MAIIPKRNLPPDAGKWARWVEDNVGTLLRDIEALRANSRATAQQINATSRAASTVVADVQAQETQATRDREIEQETQAALTQTAENLEDARQALEDAQEWIDGTGEGLNTRLTAAETALGDAETALTDLENVQLPALRDRLDDAEYDVKHISGEWITAGTIDTERLNAIEIAAETGQFLDIDVSQLVASAATIDEGVVNKLWTDVVRAHKITTDMLIVGSGDNLVPDPYFNDPSEAWTTTGSTSFETNSSSPPGREKVVRTNGSTARATSSEFVVTEGDTYRVRFWAGGTNSLSSGRASAQVVFNGVDGAAVGTVTVSNESVISAGTWEVLEELVEAPTGATTATLVFRGNALVVSYTLPSVVKATDASLIVDGGIIARHLNVTVPEGGSGVEIIPEGISLISEGSASVQLRTDLPQTIGFIDTNQEYTFSVSPEGDVAANSVAVADSLEYRGTELGSLLNALPQGIIAHSRNVQNAVIGTNDSRLLQVSFVSPTSNRHIKITTRTHAGTTAPRMYYYMVQSTGTSTTPNNSQVWSWYTPATTSGGSLTHEASWVRQSVGSMGWPLGETITLGVYCRSLDSGNTATFAVNNNQEIYIEDMGPAINMSAHTPWVPSGGGGTGGGNETQPEKRLYTQTFAPTWTRSYRGDNSFYNYQTNRLFSGQYLAANGSLRSMVGFNTSAISSFTSGSGTEMVSGRVYIKNAHTYSSSGATIQLGVHTATSAASTFSEHSSIGSAKFNRGQARWLGLGTALDGFKNGNRGGIVLRAPSFSPSQSYYSYFDAASVRLELTVRK